MEKIDTDGLSQKPEFVFARLGKELSITTSAEAAAEIILQAASTLIGWEACYLILYDPQRSAHPRPLLMIDTINNERVKTSNETMNQTPSSNMLRAIKEDGFLSLYDKQFEVPYSLSFGDRTRRTMSQLFVPVKSGTRTIGVLSIQSYAINAYTQESLETLKALSDHCAGALERIWAQELVTELSSKRNALYKAVHAINESLDLEQVCQVIHRTVRHVMACDDFIMVEYDKITNEIVPLYIIISSSRAEANRYIADHGLSGMIVHTGESVFFNTIEEMEISEIDFELVGEDHTQAIVAAPLFLHGQVIGMISAQSYKPHSYNEDDRELLEMLAPHVAIAIENARLFARVQQMADMDPLTNVLNRRKFYEMAEREFSRSERYHESLSIILLDTDNFKVLNDKFGHKAGDAILQVVAAQLKINIRSMDILCRYGGEEFIIAMPSTNAANAMQTAERLREVVERIDLNEARKFHEITSGAKNKSGENVKFVYDDLRVTVSVGVAEYAPACQTLDILVDRADRAMYAAKNGGKNHVQVWHENL